MTQLAVGAMTDRRLGSENAWMAVTLVRRIQWNVRQIIGTSLIVQVASATGTACAKTDQLAGHVKVISAGQIVINASQAFGEIR